METADAFALADLDLQSEFDPTRAAIYHKPGTRSGDGGAVAIARVPEFTAFLAGSAVEGLTAPDVEDGKTVEVVDLRFGSPAAPGLSVWTTLDAHLRPVAGGFQFDSEPLG